MKNILITGGAGFIGSNFINHVLNDRDDYKIVNLDKLTYAGNLENLTGFLEHKKHKFIKGDICDGELIAKIIDEYKIDAIINFAAESHVDRSITEPKIFIDTNFPLETSAPYWNNIDQQKIVTDKESHQKGCWWEQSHQESFDKEGHQESGREEENAGFKKGSGT